MHQMILKQTYPSEAQEWLCPICNYHFVVSWESFNRIVLCEGDTNAQHSGSTAGLQIGVEIKRDLGPVWDEGLNDIDLEV